MRSSAEDGEGRLDAVVGRGEGGEREGGEKEERGVKEEEAATMLDDEVDGTLSPPFEPLEGE